MVFIHIYSETQKCKRDTASGPVTCAADEETDGSSILCYGYEINTEVITRLSVPQPDPELSGDITGGKVTRLWQTADEQNYSRGLRGPRSDPYNHCFFFLIPSVMLKKPLSLGKTLQQLKVLYHKSILGIAAFS